MSTYMDPTGGLGSADLLLPDGPLEDTQTGSDDVETGSGSGSGDGDFYDYDLDESYASFDWTELGPSLSVYSITFLLGIVGNILILVTLWPELDRA